LLHPLSLGQVQCSISPLCCPCVMMVPCLFFSSVGQLGFGCCSLAQEMSSVIHYLPCFGECLSSAHSQPSCLSCVLIVCTEISSWPLPLSLVYFQHSCPLCYCARLQFTVFIQVFWGNQSAQGLCPEEFRVACDTHLFVLSAYAQAGLEPVAVAAVLAEAVAAMVAEVVAAVRNGSKFCHCNVLWGSFP
jgi:hypothetical protein